MWWNPYNLFRGQDFPEFWSTHVGSKRNLLFIVGRGFDPRVLGPLGKIIDLAPAVPRRCIAVEMAAAFDNDARAEELREANDAGLNKLFPSGLLEVRNLIPSDPDGIRSVARATVQMFADIVATPGAFTDIILDISTLPRLVYLTLLNQLLSTLVEPGSPAPLASATNLHVVYAEAPAIDDAIVKSEVDVELAPLLNLGVRLDEEASLQWPKIWFPVLAENVAGQLDRINTHITPDDVCPVLPIQSSDARRGDNIIRDLGELIFDRLDVDPRDIIYATEWNPFQLYRSLLETMARYEKSLRPFGGARFILSPLSSKSLSIGCLLAAFEKRMRGDMSRMRIGMAHIETRRYEAANLVPDAPFLQSAALIVPTSLWLTGECYATPLCAATAESGRARRSRIVARPGWPCPDR